MTRSDDELLALAAKAGGIDTTKPWNALTNSSDALELAVHLGLRLTLPKYKGFGTSAEPQGNGATGCTVFRDDPMEQTRHAIVRAAAHIGEQMP